jgi:hypothetical protein
MGHRHSNALCERAGSSEAYLMAGPSRTIVHICNDCSGVENAR